MSAFTCIHCLCTIHPLLLIILYPMDLPPAWSQSCACGRTFSVPQAYTYHKRSCQKTKKRLFGALEKAREVWQAKKRQRMDQLENAAKDPSAGPSNLAPEHVLTEASTPVSNLRVSCILMLLSLHGMNYYGSDHGRLCGRC
jgi:hypothetical protein